MVVMLLMTIISARATSSEVGEVIELPSDEANEVVSMNMDMWPRKMMKEGRNGENGVRLLIGTPCSSDENCLPGCSCRST
ncbi:unnamed protein product, partial [Citrullus colocynthis]